MLRAGRILIKLLEQTHIGRLRNESYSNVRGSLVNVEIPDQPFYGWDSLQTHLFKSNSIPEGGVELKDVTEILILHQNYHGFECEDDEIPRL